jgi:TolB protein
LATDELLAQARTAFDQKQWEKAVEALDRLAGLDPAYRSDEVEALRFDAWRQHGLALVNDERFEEALRAFDQALAIDPNADDVKKERELIALYVDALGLWRLDWSRVVQDLEAIQQQRPTFLDVGQRLASANDAWGDALSKEGQWCQAADRYSAAVATGAAAEIQAKAAAAEETCRQSPTVLAETPAADSTPGATVTAGITSPSANSGRLFFATYSPQTNQWNIFRLAMQGGRQPEVIAETASQPDIGPYGDFIVARSERDDQTGLVIMSATGADRRRLTTFFEDAHPQWSSDGSQVTFESNREGDRRWRIYRVGAAGGDSVFLDYGRWPAWSPRSTSIAYQTCDQGGGRCGLFLIDASGASPQSITGVPGDAMPAWSPDGSRIAFASADRGGSWDIFVLELATGNVATLASSPGVDAHPVWSPDGRQVAFLSNRDGIWAIYTIDVATGRTQQVAALPGSVPDWFEAQLSWGK